MVSSYTVTEGICRVYEGQYPKLADFGQKFVAQKVPPGPIELIMFLSRSCVLPTFRVEREGGCG